MSQIEAQDLNAEHFGKTIHFEHDYLGRHYVSHGKLTCIGNEMPYIWSKYHSRVIHKIYPGDNREVAEEGYAGPLVFIELDDDEMLELEPTDLLELVD